MWPSLSTPNVFSILTMMTLLTSQRASCIFTTSVMVRTVTRHQTPAVSKCSRLGLPKSRRSSLATSHTRSACALYSHAATLLVCHVATQLMRRTTQFVPFVTTQLVHHVATPCASHASPPSLRVVHKKSPSHTHYLHAPLDPFTPSNPVITSNPLSKP